MASYTANNYFRILQRAIRPVYFKTELGGIDFLETATFLHYANKHFIVLAFHSLDVVMKKSNIQDVNNALNVMGFLTLDGRFRLLLEKSEDSSEDSLVKYVIYESCDVIICELNNTSRIVQEVSFLNLNLNNNNKIFSENYFHWMGFPVNNASSYHKTKVSRIIQDQELLDDGKVKWLNARFLVVSAKTEYFDENDKIKGERLEKDKPKLPRGMSGGVFFCTPNYLKKEILDNNFNISQDYYFVGIGLEYDKTNYLISGLSRNKIISLINNDFL